MRYFIPLLVISLVLNACSPKVQYIGRSYPPTENVQIFFSASDVTKPYEVIGKIDGQAWELSKYDAIQEKIVEEAKKRGADAVIFTGMGEKVLSTTSNTSTVGSGGSSGTGTGNAENGKKTETGWNAAISTTTTTSNQTEKVVSADFIKYK